MDWLGDNQWAGWLALAAALGVAEMFSLDLILIMLAVGAVAGMLTGLVGGAFILQVLVAAGASVASSTSRRRGAPRRTRPTTLTKQ